MAILFSYPKTDATVPTVPFFAFGTFDAGAVAPAKCTFTPNAGAAVIVDIDLSRTDGIWTAMIPGLDATKTYTADAFYTNAAGNPVNADQQINITASPNAAAPRPRPPRSPVPPAGVIASALAGGAAGGARAAFGPPPDVLTIAGFCNPLLQFSRVYAVVHQTGRPARVTSIHTVNCLFGEWTVVVACPPDFPGVSYDVQIVWVDKDGLYQARTTQGLV